MAYITSIRQRYMNCVYNCLDRIQPYFFSDLNILQLVPFLNQTLYDIHNYAAK